MLEYIAKNRALVHSELKRILTKKKKELGTINQWPGLFLPKIQEFVLGGKCLRGSLALFAYQASGKKIDAKILKVAAGMELIHAGLIIHDDIMDNDEFRHGKKSIYKQFVDELHSDGAGRGMGICAGDIAYFLGMEIIAEEIGGKLLAYVNNELNKVAFAQMQDIYFGNSKKLPKENEVINLYKYKTARYTFSLPLVLGSSLAGTKSQKLLEGLGEHFGIIFQIKDDELNLLANEKDTGKAQGADIRTGKKTLYYLHLLAGSSSLERKKLAKIFGETKSTKQDIQFVLDLLEKKKIKNKIDKLLVKEKSISEAIISKLPFSIQNKKMLLEFLEYNLNRIK